jgi:hypothetical protein
MNGLDILLLAFLVLGLFAAWGNLREPPKA